MLVCRFCSLGTSPRVWGVWAGGCVSATPRCLRTPWGPTSTTCSGWVRASSPGSGNAGLWLVNTLLILSSHWSAFLTGCRGFCSSPTSLTWLSSWPRPQVCWRISLVKFSLASFLRANFLVVTKYVYDWIFSSNVKLQSICLSCSRKLDKRASQKYLFPCTF